MESWGVSDGRVDGESVQDFESMGFGDSGYNERFLLEDLDSYLDDLNGRLIVSRMVNDSIVKGIASAMAQEASVEVCSKDVEMEVLKEMMFASEVEGTRCSICGSFLTDTMTEGTTPEVKTEWLDQGICIDDLKLMSRKHLSVLKNEIKYLENVGIGDGEACSVLDRSSLLGNLSKMSSSVDMLNTLLEATYEHASIHVPPQELLSEQQWRWDLEKEIHGITIGYFIKDIQEEFRIGKKEHSFKNRGKTWLDKCEELSNLRDELNAIATSTLGSEEGIFEFHEEWRPTNRKDNSSRKALANYLPLGSQTHVSGDVASDKTKKHVLEVVDVAKLKHLTKEELITYYTTEIAKMSRHHESALHEKTEELFRLKRQLLRERGNLPLKKDKEFENLRSKICDLTSKLDDILEVDDNNRILNLGAEDHICSFKDRVSVLLAENQRIKDSLAEKNKELMRLSMRISDAACQVSLHTSAEMKFLEQIRKLRQDLDDLKIKEVLHDEVVDIIITNGITSVISSVQNLFENLQTEADIDHDIQLLVFSESIRCASSFINTVLHRHESEEKILKEEVSKKDEALRLEVAKSSNLQDKTGSLSRQVEEQELIAQEYELLLMQQREKFEVSHRELNSLRMRKEDAERQVLQKEQEMDILKDRLEGANRQIYQCSVEIQEVKGTLEAALNNIAESENQRMILEKVIQEEKINALSAIKERDIALNKMKSVMLHTVDLSGLMDNFESVIEERIQRNESRLANLKHMYDPLPRKARSLQRQICQYQSHLEIKISNLQKAEDEVDLLGDEVEALLSIFAKLYITLDHYSHVLQHYPGVMEVLSLVRTTLEKSVTPYRKP